MEPNPEAAASQSTEAPAEGTAPAEGEGQLSKKAQKKLEKQKKKDEQKAAKAEKHAPEEEYKKDPNDPAAHLFGELDLNRSQSDPEKRYTKKFTPLSQINKEMNGQETRVRARMANARAAGKKGTFMVLREGFATLQSCVFASETVSEGMVEFCKKIPKESFVEVVGVVTATEQDVKGASQNDVELQAQEVWITHKSAPRLPFHMVDAMHRQENQAVEDAPAKKDEEEKGGKKVNVVMQDTRLNHRIIDLRLPTNHAIMRVQSAVCRLFRQFLYTQDFVEIHSPKLIGGTSEGGAEVFRLKYFGRDACLAQSPQLYKQMGVCSDLPRVFEVGPVFRAENSQTNRHLCEFTGLDIEMAFYEHYFEVLDLLGDMFTSIFEGLNQDCKKELATINEQYPFEPFRWTHPVVRIDFREGVQMLKEAGLEQDPKEDLSTECEKALGRLVREKYDSDFYILYRYPKNARPFYSMLDPFDSEYTNSYDIFMRGEEITSGAQRIHDPELLAERATALGIDVATIQDYIDAFKFGAPAHAGAGIGLERVVKLFLGLHNIRKCSMFPRDPKRLAP